MSESSGTSLDVGESGKRLGHVMVGLYLWEWFISLDFEWDFIVGRKRLRWPMFFYFGNRYLLFGHLVASVILWSTQGQPHALDCKLLYGCLRIFGKGSLAFASINLALRTIAIWERNGYIITVLGIVMVAEFTVIIVDMRDVLKTSQWDPKQRFCVNKSSNNLLRIVFLISMSFDLLVLVLNSYKIGIRTLAFFRYSKKHKVEQSILKLTYLVWSQGVVYFFVAFCVNAGALVIVTLPSLSVNNVYRVYAMPAYVISTIVACRAVRALTKSGSELTDIAIISHDPAFDVRNDKSNPPPSRISFAASLTADGHRQEISWEVKKFQSSSSQEEAGFSSEVNSIQTKPLEGDDVVEIVRGR